MQLPELRQRGPFDLSCAVVDSSSARTVLRRKTELDLPDRRKVGSEHHLITDARGILLEAILIGANANDVTQLLPLVASIPPIRG